MIVKARTTWLLLLLLLAAGLQAGPLRPAPEGLSAEDGAALRGQIAALEARLARLRSRPEGAPARLVDAAVFLKGARWALRYSDRLAPADVAAIRRALDRAGA